MTSEKSKKRSVCSVLQAWQGEVGRDHLQLGHPRLLGAAVPAPGNIYATPLRFKLGGHPVLSARFNEWQLPPPE
jgi:hypothetical protein